ncbi:MAG TPA: RuBisCO large subunit C-terminal-like domain-containing protein [Burkholderiaceae bacterium]|nr:RuBisCO large subunit C-terminal-like domain-containing protein [Burkholderiaceae bacterium]
MTDALRVGATYRLHVAPDEASHRAQQLALEQSIEMLASSVTDQRVLDAIVARVDSVAGEPDGTHTARLALSAEAIGDDPGQLMNMLFGNSSMQPDVELIAVEVPSALARTWGGPNQGIAGMRRHTGAFGRPLTCTALKPIGSTLEALSQMCSVFAQAGIDVIKDDHGWANQRSAPFAQRVRACQQAVARGNATRSRGQALYAPSLYGHYGDMRSQLNLARGEGVQAVLMAPMVCGVATLVALKREFSDVLFIAHPSLTGLRISPAILLGKLFRLFGADAVIFPNHGGRFSFSRDACDAIAKHNTEPWHGLKPSLPTPAGGMSVDRTKEIVSEYGCDSMLLIGGALLAAREQLAARSVEFVNAVAAAASDTLAA